LQQKAVAIVPTDTVKYSQSSAVFGKLQREVTNQEAPKNERTSNSLVLDEKKSPTSGMLKL
jgi:hypothetical protein